MSLGNHTFRLTRQKIAARLKLIAPLVFRRAAPIAPFRLLPLDGAILDAPICADPIGWDTIAPGSYWGQADLNFVLKSTFSVPKGWDADRIALYLPLGVLGDIFNHPEAMAYVDKVPIGSADRYHHTLPLSPALADNRRHTLSLHGWTGHAGWPPDPQSSAKLHMGDCKVVEMDPATEDFVNLATVAVDSLAVLDDPAVAEAILSALDQAFLQLDTRDPMGDAFYDSVPGAIDTLRRLLDDAGPPLDVTLHGIGHAHMDIAYLWPISQIRLKNARTYSNVLRLMETDADFRFSHSQPALYEMTANDHPALFDRISARIADGRWEVMGGMWVEPDLNVPGPEALIRQLTLGRGYFRDIFGDVETPVLWLPDTFGFPGQIPQLMKLAGLDWFVTNKLNWNQYNRVPWATHIWEGIDGTRVKTHILTTPRDVQYLPFPTNYKSDLSAREVMGTWSHAGEAPAKSLPICYGYGDGGGGPTADLLAKARAYASFPGMPQFRMSTVKEALAALDATADDLPVWRGEHYLEGHRGVYTSQGWIKRANRLAERALHEAESLAAMAGQQPDLTEAWKLLCLNQFHDIVTGTSVAEVYEDARADYARIDAIAAAALSDATAALSGNAPSVASLIPAAGPRVVQIAAADGPHLQPIADGALAHFPSLPPYSLTTLDQACAPAVPVTVAQDGERITLTNAHLHAVFDGGQLATVIDRATGRDIIRPGAFGNSLLAFEDRPICWDAWDIDPHYEDRCDTIGPPVTVSLIETGPIRATLQLDFAWASSRISQRVALAADSRRLDFQTTVDWHQTHTLLKVAFPLGFSAPEALFDIQWGAITRATRRESAFDAARFEVPAQKWALLSDGALSVAVMNDCKYGYDVREDTIRLTLIKSATSPDPNADQGRHVFTYGLYVGPHDDVGARHHAAYDLNTPARIIDKAGAGGAASGLAFVETDAPNVLIQTVKPGAAPGTVVLRAFETEGMETHTTLRLPPGFSHAQLVDIFEASPQPLSVSDGNVTVPFAPFQIVTLLLTP